jgi:hypothetical protein
MTQCMLGGARERCCGSRMTHRTVTISLSLAVAFLVGCVAAPYIVPPARAGSNP